MLWTQLFFGLITEVSDGGTSLDREYSDLQEEAEVLAGAPSLWKRALAFLGELRNPRAAALMMLCDNGDRQIGEPTGVRLPCFAGPLASSCSLLHFGVQLVLGCLGVFLLTDFFDFTKSRLKDFSVVDTYFSSFLGAVLFLEQDLLVLGDFSLP